MSLAAWPVIFQIFGLFDELRMNGQADQEEGSIFVGFKDRWRGAVLLHGLQHLRDAGAAALCKAQLFEEFTDAAVAVAASGKPAGLQLRDVDGAVEPRIAGNGDFFGQDADFNRFPDFVAAMVDGVYNGFLQSGVGHVKEAVGLGSIAMFDDALLDDGVAQVGAGGSP